MEYESLCEQIQSLAEAEPHYVPLLANAAALLYDALPDLNWAGFYLMRGNRLVLDYIIAFIYDRHLINAGSLVGA